MKKVCNQLTTAFLTLLIFIASTGNTFSCDDLAKKMSDEERKWFLLGKMAGYVGLSLLGSIKMEPQKILVLTNAGYARLNGESTAMALEGVSWITETSAGKGNLFRVQSPRNSILWFALFDRETGDIAYLEAPKVLNEEIHEKIFKTRKENISLKRLLGDPMGWDLKLKDRPFGGREFSIITFSHQWASGAPFELLQLGTFHDHICPGLTQGYMIAGYLDRHLPLGPREKYFFISLSPSCQDDALQVIYNATVGKKMMNAISLTEEQRSKLLPIAKNVTGLYIAWDEKAERGRGMSLSFDWDALKTKREGLGWLWRLQMNQELLSIINEPEKVVRKATEFHLPPGKNPSDLISIEMKSLKEIGIIRE